jgi:hypothetical protein
LTKNFKNSIIKKREEYMTASFYFDNDVLEENLQSAKTSLLNVMFSNDDITKEVYENYLLNYGIIIKKASFFNKAWKKLVKPNEKEELSIVVVEQKTLSEKKLRELSES